MQAIQISQAAGAGAGAEAEAGEQQKNQCAIMCGKMTGGGGSAKEGQKGLGKC